MSKPCMECIYLLNLPTTLYTFLHLSYVCCVFVAVCWCYTLLCTMLHLFVVNRDNSFNKRKESC